MKFFTKTQKQQTIDPRSRGFTLTIRKLLEDHGLTDKRKVNECSFGLFKVTIKFMHQRMKCPEPTDEELKQLELDMGEVLDKFGITDKAAQEEILTTYMDTLLGLGGQG